MFSHYILYFYTLHYKDAVAQLNWILYEIARCELLERLTSRHLHLKSDSEFLVSYTSFSRKSLWEL